MRSLVESGFRGVVVSALVFGLVARAESQGAVSASHPRGIVATRVEFPKWRPSLGPGEYRLRPSVELTLNPASVVSSQSGPGLRNYVLLGALGGAVVGGGLTAIGVATSCKDDCMMAGAAVGAGVVLGALVGSLVGVVAWSAAPDKS
jgi:hypothetical protein